MQINLSEVLNQPDGNCEYTVPCELDTISFQGSVYEIRQKEPVQISVRHGKQKKLTIRTKVDMTLAMPCDRCLKEVLVPFQFTSTDEIDMDQSDEERIQNLEEAAFICEYTLDVDKLVEGEMFVHMPMKVLCSEDCSGLLEDYDTVSGPETGDREEAGSDPRMSAIRDLFQNYNSEGSKEV